MNYASAANNSTCSFDFVTAGSVDITRIADLGSNFFQFLLLWVFFYKIIAQVIIFIVCYLNIKLKRHHYL